MAPRIINQKIFLLGFVILFLGCAKLEHLDQLLILKDFSEERDAQEKFIQAELKRFERVAQAVEDGSIAKYETGAQIIQAFGRPMASLMITRDEKPFQQWLYRHPIQAQAKTRVYLYLSSDSRLVHWERVLSSEPESLTKN